MQLDLQNGVCRWLIRCLPITIIGFQLLAGGQVNAAELQWITGQMADDVFPHDLHEPVVYLTAMSGDGRTIAAQARETGVDYDCARNECGVVPLLWSVDDPTMRRGLLTPTQLPDELFRWDAVPVRISALSQNGSDLLVNSEFRHYEAAIIDTQGQPELLRTPVRGERLWGAGMSSDANVVVGNVEQTPFIWERGSGLQLIDDLPDNHRFIAQAVSGDGRLTVLNPLTFGDAQLVGNAQQWSEQDGAAELLPLAGDDYSHAVAVSFDGTFVVGQSFTRSTPGLHLARAVLWNSGLPMGLELIDGFDGSIARDTSGDGSLIVGEVYEKLGEADFGLEYFDWQTRTFLATVDSRAVLWSANGDVFDLKSFLADRFGLGEELAGWHLASANLMSDDGSVIAGHGINPAGDPAIWIASFSVPEPTAPVSFAAIGLLSLLLRRGRNKV